MRKDLKDNRSTLNSRVGAFPEVFGMADHRSEGAESRSKPGVGWRLAFGEFGDDWSIFIKPRGQSGVVRDKERAE